MIESKNKGDEKRFAAVSKLHQRLYEATTEDEVVRIKQEFHALG